jgi:outer membrane protein assembly factor BamB
MVKKMVALKDGKKVMEFRTAGGSASSPCVGPDNTVYFAGADKKIYALSTLYQRLSNSTIEADVDPASGEKDDGFVIEDGWIISDEVKLRVNGCHDNPGGGSR